MKQVELISKVTVFSWEELTKEVQTVIEAAKKASFDAYAPYSGFSVGVAVLLEDGTIVTGNNQENEAFPSGLCAERTAIFYANSRYPRLPVKLLVIAAQSGGDFLCEPIAPCGACRQVLLETERRFSQSIGIYLYGTDKIVYSQSIEALLPLSFSLKRTIF